MSFHIYCAGLVEVLRFSGRGLRTLQERSAASALVTATWPRRPIWHVFKPQGCLVYYTSSYVSFLSISTQCAPAVLSPAGMDPQPDGAGSLCGAGPYQRGSHAHVLADDGYTMHLAHAYACHACSWSRHNRLCSSSRGACGEFLAAIPGAGSMLGDDEFVDSLQRSHRPPQGHRSTSPWPRKNTTARTNHRKETAAGMHGPSVPACTISMGCKAGPGDTAQMASGTAKLYAGLACACGGARGTARVTARARRWRSAQVSTPCIAGRCPVGAGRCPVGAGQLKVRSAPFERS